MKRVFIFIVLLLVVCLIQVSWVPLPLGLILIFWLVFRNRTNYIIWSSLAFSLILAFLANIPAWLVLLATTLSVYLFILGRSFLPSRLLWSSGLVIVSLVTWEAALVGLLRIFN